MMSCFGTSRHPRRNSVPERLNTDEDQEYREYRNKVQSEHRSAFLPSLRELIAFVTNRDRHCDVDEIIKGDLKRLDRVRYFRSLKSLYPDVDFTIDTKKGKVHLRGRGKSFENAYDMCFIQVREMNIVERNLELNMEDKWKWDIVANVHCKQYLGEKMTSNDIMAKITAGNSVDIIIVTALDEIEWQKARKLLDESLIQDVLPIPNGADTWFDFESSQFHHFKTEQEKNKPLKILFQQSDDETPTIQFVGVKDNVVEAKKATKDFIESHRKREYKLTLKLSEDKFNFLERHFSKLVKHIEDNSKVDMQKLEPGPEICTFNWKGQPETFTECAASLEELCKSILEKDETIELPGVEQLFKENTDGGKVLELLQKADCVYIDRKLPSFKRERFVSESAAQRGAIEEGTIHKKAVVIQKDRLENLIISLKHGRIEDERADVLAYFALPDLNDGGNICGKALKQVGGTTYIEVCKPHTNISHGDVVCTTGGNLACRYVLHAVGCDMKVSKENNKKVARILINKCLQKCIDLRVASLAMSSFTADEHGAEEFFEMVCEEMERLNASNPVQYPLRSVQIVYLKRRHLEKRKTAPPRRRKRSFHPQHTGTGYCYCRKFESVDVVLREGELSTFKADAIINILPNLHLPSDNSACETILQAAGAAVQDEMKRHTRNSHPGSIFITSAGSIKNVEKILHIIPASTDDPGMQSSLEQCLNFVKSLSLSNVLFPIAATMSLEVTVSHLLKLILVATENCSIYDSVPLEIVVLVERISEFDNLKLLFNEVLVADVHVQDTGGLQNIDDKSIVASHVDDDDVLVSQETPTASLMLPSDLNRTAGISKSDNEAQISIPASKRDEDKISLRFVGFQSAVYDSISEVMSFVDRNKATKSIEISKDGLQFRQDQIEDLDRLSSIYHVLICLRTREITVEGIEKNALECKQEIERLLKKYESNKDETRQPLEEANKENKFVTNEARSDVDNNSTITNIPEDRVDSESPTSWLWEKKSKVHREKFEKLIEYGQKHPEEIKEIGGARFCCSSDAFCIGHGSDGTSVCIGLSKDGYEKAVKCLLKNRCGTLAKHEKDILNKPNTTASKHTVKYWYFDDQSDTFFAYLILDLYEESLEEYVERNDQEHLTAFAPDIIRQILEGLNDIHQKPTPILHRDLNPSNIMRDVEDTWLLSDFGISRILPKNKKIHESTPRGNEHWRAAESHHLEGASNESNVQYQKESDIQIAGMVFYFIVSKGQHPFGPEAQRVSNILKGDPVGLNCIKDPVLKDLLAWMLSHNPEERPSAKEAMKHPYLQKANKQFELLCTVGNQCKIKAGDFTADIVRQINSDTEDWRALMDVDVYDYLCIDPKKSTPNMYSNQWTDCLRFIRNAKQHWKDPKSASRPKSIEGEPQEYFLKIYPSFPMIVHKILRSSDWKEREDFTKFFT